MKKCSPKTEQVLLETFRLKLCPEVEVCYMYGGFVTQEAQEVTGMLMP